MEMKQLVTKDMLIGEVITKYPDIASIMLSYGLHCVGCSANPFDTIESGCMIHGMDEETVNNLVVDINKEIESSEQRKGKTISITKRAVEKFNEFMDEETKPVTGIRLTVSVTEGSFQYSLDFVTKPNKTEEVFEDSGVKIFVEKDIINMIKGTEIDFVENAKGSGFKITNNNSVGSCGSGCGCH